MKLLKYYLTSGTFEHPVIAIIAQVFYLFLYLYSCMEKETRPRHHFKSYQCFKQTNKQTTTTKKTPMFLVVILFLCRFKFSKQLSYKGLILGQLQFYKEKKHSCISFYSHLPFYKKTVLLASAAGI